MLINPKNFNPTNVSEQHSLSTVWRLHILCSSRCCFYFYLFFLKILFYFLKIIYLFIFRERGRKGKEKERNINVWLPFTSHSLGPWPATQACALTGNRTCDLSVLRLVLNLLNHTSQSIFILFLGRGEGREKERERNINGCGCFSCTPYWGPGPQPRHVPWLGFELITHWFASWCSIHWTTPARAQCCF